jgi:hypothetical protein
VLLVGNKKTSNKEKNNKDNNETNLEEVLNYYILIFGENDPLLTAYKRGNNEIVVEKMWFNFSDNDDGYRYRSGYSLKHQAAYRIKIDPRQNAIQAALLLHEELLDSRTSAYVVNHLDTNYFTEEFVKNRLGQLDQMKEKMEEVRNVIELGGSVAFEPIDWLLSFNEFIETGNPTSLAFSLIPVIPGGVSKITKTIPDFRKVNFNAWFDTISLGELENFLKNKKNQEIIRNNLRLPGGYHEWLPVSEVLKFKEWGVTAEQIKTWRTKTSEVKFVNPSGKHRGSVGSRAHQEIISLVKKANSFNEYKSLLHEWAKKRLPNGINDLPVGLR